MKYASKVIGLLGAHPERGFKMNQIVRHTMGSEAVDQRTKARVRVGVYRVLKQLEANGSVRVLLPDARGRGGVYTWNA